MRLNYCTHGKYCQTDKQISARLSSQTVVTAHTQVLLPLPTLIANRNYSLTIIKVFKIFLTCTVSLPEVCDFAQVMEDDEHYVDDPKNPQFQHHGGEYAYQGGNSGGDFEGECFQGEHEGYQASGQLPCSRCGLLCSEDTKGHNALSDKYHWFHLASAARCSHIS